MIVKTWGSAVTQFFEKIIFQVSILNRRRAISRALFRRMLCCRYMEFEPMLDGRDQ